MSTQELFKSAQIAHRNGQLSEAETQYKRILADSPHNSSVRMYYSIVLQQTGRSAEAFSNATRAIEDGSSDDATLWVNYGVILKNQGEFKQAENAYQRALSIDPAMVHAKANIASLKLINGDLDGAERLCQQLIQVSELQGPFQNLVRIYLHRKNFQEALAIAKKADDLHPKDYETKLLLGKTYLGLFDYSRAAKALLKAVALNPFLEEAWIDLLKIPREEIDHAPIHEAQSVIAAQQSNDLKLLSAVCGLSRKLCIWDYLDQLEKLMGASIDQGVFSVPSLSAVFNTLASDLTQEQHLRLARAAWKGHVSVNRVYESKTLLPRSQRKNRIRVGLVSSDFKQHAGATLLAGVVEHLPKENIEWFAYANKFDDDSPFRARLRKGFDHFVNIAPLDDEEFAERIVDDEIDILLDRNGMTRDTRVFVTKYRPAPIIGCYLGYPGSLGADGDVDFLIGDNVVVDHENETGFSEKVIKLDRCYQPNDNQINLGPETERSDHGLPDDAFVFCSFNQHYKLSPVFFDTWMSLLVEHTNSILWLLEPHSMQIKAELINRAKINGVLSDRLIFAKNVSHPEHLERIRHADLILDSGPYNAHTTASDALRVGVPVLTLPGKTFASRVAKSILVQAGLNDWVSNDMDGYRSVASNYCQQSHDQVAAVKQDIKTKYWESSLPDVGAYAQELELQLLCIYDDAVNSQTPAS